MKRKILGFIIGLFLIVGLTQSGYAAIQNWYFDFDGGDTTTGMINVSEYLDIESPNFVDITDVTGASYDFTFTNVGFVAATNVDSKPGGGLGSYAWVLNGEYSYTGTGTYGGSINFIPGGELTLSLGTTEIATLTLLSGSGQIDTAGIPNGDITMTYSIDVTDPNTYYFYQSDGAGGFTPLSNLQAITTTNASMITNVDDDLKSDLLGLAGVTAAGPEDMFLSSNGQFRVVPVPSALLLLGSGIIGLVGFRRKNS